MTYRAVSGVWILLVLVGGCAEREAADTRQAAGAGGVEEEQDAGEADCPIHATECPAECHSIGVTRLVTATEPPCLGPSEVVGCYPREELGGDQITCSVSADGSYVHLGGIDNTAAGYLVLHHGYRSCAVDGEHEYMHGLESCEE